MVSNPASSALREDNVLGLLAVLAVAAGFYLFLGRALLFDVDEGAFSQATLEMFQRADFLSTTLNGAPRYDKPILVYWLQAASVMVFGAREFAFRLPSALCATLWALAVFLFARRAFGLRAGLFATVAMATSLGVYAIARAATADALLNMLIATSMFAAWMHLDTQSRRWLYLTHAAIGLGFLAKGPIAILVPFAVTFLFCLLRRDLRTWARAVFDWRALLVFAVLALPWYAAVLYKEGWAFFQGFFMRHNVGRFEGPLHGHAGSMLYYFPVVLVGLLPYTGLLVPLWRRLPGLWRQDLGCYLLLWFAFVFVFFSLSGTKLPHYMLYGTSGIFVLFGVVAAQPGAVRSTALLPALLTLLVLLALPHLVVLALPHVKDAYYREAFAGIEQAAGMQYLIVAGAAVLLAVLLLALRGVAPVVRLGASGVVIVVVLSAVVVPLAASVQQSPIREAALLCREHGWDPIVWGLSAPSFSVYRGAPTLNRDPRAGDIVLTKSKRLAALQGRGVEVLYRKNGIVLLRLAS